MKIRRIISPHRLSEPAQASLRSVAAPYTCSTCTLLIWVSGAVDAIAVHALANFFGTHRLRQIGDQVILVDVTDYTTAGPQLETFFITRPPASGVMSGL